MKELINKIKELPTSTIAFVGIGIVGIVVLATILISNMQPTKTNIAVLKEEFVVEYGEPISLEAKDYIKADKEVLKETKIDVSDMENEDDKDYPNVGTYKATATYKEEELTFKIVVKDTTAPEFVDFKETLEIEKGNKEYDFISQYKAEDLSKVTITVDSSKVNFDVVGDYTIDVSVTDEYKNETTKTATVKVTEPVAVEEDTNNPVDNNQTQDTGTTDTYVPNTGTDNNTVVTPAQPQPSDPAPTTCNANGQWKQLSNSGVGFYGDNEAEAYGWAHLGDNPEWNGFALIAIQDICGIGGYSVRFY